MTKLPAWDEPTLGDHVISDSLEDTLAAIKTGDKAYGKINDTLIEVTVENLSNEAIEGPVTCISPAMANPEGIEMGATVILPHNKRTGITKT